LNFPSSVLKQRFFVGKQRAEIDPVTSRASKYSRLEVMIPAAEGTFCFALPCFVLTAHPWQNQKYLFSLSTLRVQQELNYQPAYCDCPRSITNEQMYQGLHHG